ncbi:YkgJ family cysteine cluster protein [Methanosarcinales archaeon]|nr:MAG: YkgJ family cysteine cluster protein [Methanosarcinales archaeon]
MEIKRGFEGRQAKQPGQLHLSDSFQFECRKGIKCFNQCCADVNILLTPYDVLRMKNSLGITSGEFLRKYTNVIRSEKAVFPIVALKMKDDEQKQCYFVSEEGCEIYEDRPWACRMFPLDKRENEGDEPVFTLIKKQGCLGFEQKKVWKIEDWIVNQGITIYEKYESLYQDITEHERTKDLEITNPDVFLMVQMALYDLDRFRKFVFESNFLNYFEVEKGRIETIKRDDAELLVFGIEWVKFGLLGQQTFQVKKEVADRKKKELEKKGLLKQNLPDS